MKNSYNQSHRLLMFISLIFFILNFTINAQSVSSGTLEGIVLNGSNDLPVENSIVKIIELDRFDVTDKNGIFQFNNLPFGSYNLDISYIGFKTAKSNIIIDKEINKGLIIHLFVLPIETSPVIVTGSHSDSKFDDMNEFINVLKGKELHRESGLTLASTLKNETGLSIRSMGPAPARPVIRGLGSDRIAITEDGILASDLSATSPDHAVAIEPFTIDRIEVIRGPKVLLKNSTTMGGVVNVIREDISDHIPSKWSGMIGSYFESANSGYLGSTTLKIPINKFVFRGEASYRKTKNLSTPTGILNNSNLQTNNYNAAFSFVDSWGHTGISIREFESNYGIPGGFVGAHPNGVDISMLKRQINGKINLDINSETLEKLTLQISRDYYKQTEYERKNIIGAQFVIYSLRGNLDLSNKKIGLLDFGTTGISFDYKDFNIGGYVFTPPTKSINISGYSFQSFEIDFLSFEAGVRFSFDNFKPRAANPSTDPEYILQREFITYSFSFSTLFSLSKSTSLGINFNKSSRVPTIEELYSEGPHLAAYSYEIGNPKLKSENGFGVELFSYLKAENAFLMFTLFRNDFSYFITPRNSGSLNSQTLLPIYKTNGVEALFYGAESYLEIDISENIVLTNSFSYTFGKFTHTDNPLPQIPPVKNFLQIKYSMRNFTTGLSSEIVADQNRVDIFESPTTGYIIFNTFMQLSFETANLIHGISLNLDNIFNKEHRNHLSRVKVIMPESGVNLRISYRMYF